jgi:dolichol-phosphate mannosyltransferase
MLISIIIPTKNEPSIQELIDEIDETIKVSHEIIIIDKSNPRPNVKGAEVINQESDGLGNAFVEGLSHAKGDIIALMDGDGSHRPLDLANMLDKIYEYDIVLGSKLVKGGKSCDALGRKIITQAFAWITRFFLRIDIKDPMTGLMAARRDVFNDIKLNPRGFKIVIEVVYKSKAKAVEVPILFCERKSGSSKVGFNMNGVSEMFRIFALLFELRLGRVRGYW